MTVTATPLTWKLSSIRYSTSNRSYYVHPAQHYQIFYICSFIPSEFCYGFVMHNIKQSPFMCFVGYWNRVQLMNLLVLNFFRYRIICSLFGPHTLCHIFPCSVRTHFVTLFPVRYTRFAMLFHVRSAHTLPHFSLFGPHILCHIIPCSVRTKFATLFPVRSAHTLPHCSLFGPHTLCQIVLHI